MISPYHRLCLCAFGLAAAVSGVAQTPPTESTPVPTPTTAAPQVQPQDTGSQNVPRRRHMSPELAAALSAGVKYEAPAPEKQRQEQQEEAEETDLRETDKPRNTIIRLPKYVVEGERPPVFTEREVHTQKGLADLAIKRYLSSAHQRLNKYHLPAFLGGISNEELAMIMYRDEERQRNMREFDDKVYLYRQTGDTEGADALKDDAYSTFLRKSEFSEAPRANGK